MPESISITDNRTGEAIEVPIVNGGVDSAEWAKLLPGIWFSDPSFGTTAAAQSEICEIKGDEGILRYRGYPIEQLAEKSTYLEVAYLLIHGELPTEAQYADWVYEVTHHTFIHENFRRRFFDAFHYDAHPMAMMAGVVGSLSAFYHDKMDMSDPEHRMLAAKRMIAKMPTIAAACYRGGLPVAGVVMTHPEGFEGDVSTNSNAEEIARQAGAMHDKFVGFVTRQNILSDGSLYSISGKGISNTIGILAANHPL